MGCRVVVVVVLVVVVGGTLLWDEKRGREREKIPQGKLGWAFRAKRVQV